MVKWLSHFTAKSRTLLVEIQRTCDPCLRFCLFVGRSGKKCIACASRRSASGHRAGAIEDGILLVLDRVGVVARVRRHPVEASVVLERAIRRSAARPRAVDVTEQLLLRAPHADEVARRRRRRAAPLLRAIAKVVAVKS
eukprot:6843909-Prymnesium_polylepis.1